MNAIFCGMLLLGVIYAAWSGQADAAQRALLTGGEEAVALCLSLAGAYAFFGGLLGVTRESGAVAALAAALRRPLMQLFRFRVGEEAALHDICVNMSANMLGMGGAATPAGISAMRRMAEANGAGASASDAMILFLVINTSSVQLLPTTMIALRAQMGAANPADIVLPTLISTCASTVCGVALCLGLRGRGARGG
ncbi:MAG: spore maturation protein [Clostridia bacterium]|nr:spore maturation protein [Clostridia bacterium]